MSHDVLNTLMKQIMTVFYELNQDRCFA